MVWGVYLIEVLQIVMSVRDAFRCFGSEWGRMEIIDVIGWQWFSVPVLIALSTMSPLPSIHRMLNYTVS